MVEGDDGDGHAAAEVVDALESGEMAEGAVAAVERRLMKNPWRLRRPMVYQSVDDTVDAAAAWAKYFAILDDSRQA